jgi:predicted GIY-YIG superfamily endonuclease
MWFVYVLRGVKGKFLYVGATDDLDAAMAEHAAGEVPETARQGALRCELYVALPTKKQAQELAAYLRTPAGKRVLTTRFLLEG